MVVMARLRFLRHMASRGHQLHIVQSFSTQSRSIKVKFLVGGTAGVVPPAFQQEFIDAIERLMRSAGSYVIVDRGHTHHDHRSAICLWLKPRAAIGRQGGNDANDGRPPRPPEDEADDGDHGPDPDAGDQRGSFVPRSADAGADPGASAHPGVDRNVRPRLHNGAPPFSGWRVRNTFLEYHVANAEEDVESRLPPRRCHSAPHIEVSSSTQFFAIGESDGSSSFDESEDTAWHFADAGLELDGGTSLMPFPPIPSHSLLGSESVEEPAFEEPILPSVDNASSFADAGPEMGGETCELPFPSVPAFPFIGTIPDEQSGEDDSILPPLYDPCVSSVYTADLPVTRHSGGG